MTLRAPSDPDNSGCVADAAVPGPTAGHRPAARGKTRGSGGPRAERAPAPTAGAGPAQPAPTPTPSPSGTPTPPPTPPPPAPIVYLPDRAASHIDTHRQIHALFTAAQPLTFFASADGRRLVEPGPAGIEDVTATRFATSVQRRMSFRRRNKKDAAFAELPDLTARRMISYPAPGLWPPLRGVAQHPILLPGGRWLDTPGYAAASEWFLRWEGPAIDSARITDRVVRWVWKRLLDFEWVDPSSYWHAMGMWIQPYGRPAIEGPTPLYVVGSAGQSDAGDVPGSGAGKTCLVQTIGLAAIGQEPTTINLDAWDSEARRQLAGPIVREPEILLLDNLGTGSILGGPLLHQLLTAYERTTIREVGSTTREVAVRALWAATGNGVELDGEQIRRSVRVQIRPGRTRPYLTRGILSWARRPRTRALVAAVVRRLVEDWIAAGRPRPPRSLDGYQGWSDVVGGIVCHYGGAAAEAAWLAPASRPQPAIEREWGRVFAAWPTTANGTRRELPAAAVVGLLDGVDAPTLSAAVAKGRTPRGMASRMGTLLRGRVDRPTGLWILRTGTAHGGATWYRPDPLPLLPPNPGPGPTGRGGVAGTEGPPSPAEEPSEPRSLQESPVLSIPGGTGGTGGTTPRPSTIADTRGAHEQGSGAPPTGARLVGGPSGPSGPTAPVIPTVCAEGPDHGRFLRSPPRSLRGRWPDEVEAMQERGVRVDPDLWGAAVADLRAAGIEATREALDPADAEAALHRLIALDAYALDVQAQAELDPEQRVRATWNPEGTWTGRITARQPPLQSLTRRGRLRGAVVPAPGCAFVVGDFSQSQLRIVAALSGDEALRRALEPGRDPHAEIGQAVAAGHPAARDVGKLLNFAILYLAGADKLVQAAADKGIALDRKVARNLIRRLRTAYPALDRWRPAQRGRTRVEVRWDGEVRRTVDVPPGAFDAATGEPRLPAILAGIAQAHEVEALRYVLDHTEERLGISYGYRPVLLLHDEVVWEGPAGAAQAAAEAARALMAEGLAGVTNGVPIVVQVAVRSSWAKNA